MAFACCLLCCVFEGTEDGTIVSQARLSSTLGYQVLVDEQCTYDDFMKYLASEDVQAFIFIGHSDELGLVPTPSFKGDLRSITPGDVKQTLRSRKLERVELNACHIDTQEWRNAFNDPKQFIGMKGLYNPVVGIDYGRSFLENLLKRKRNDARKTTR